MSNKDSVLVEAEAVASAAPYIPFTVANSGLKVGDHVSSIKPAWAADLPGVIVVLQDESDHPGKLIGIRLDEPNDNGHELDGACEEKHGVWTRPEYLHVIEALSG